MGIRLRTKKLIRAGLIGAAIMLVFSSVGAYLIYSNAQKNALKQRQEYNQKIEELEQIAKSNHKALRLVTKVKKGEQITESMVKPVYVPAAAASKDLTTIPSLESTKYFAKTDLAAKTVLTDAFLYEEEPIGNDTREAEYAFIELPTDLKKAEYVDIRVQFPSGEDYVLLSKKKIKKIAGITTWFNIDEGEILTMSSAIVDAYVEGAKIYAMKYVDEHMQTKSQMTYPVKKNVLELIRESPNVVDIAKLNLEQQNRDRLNNSLKALSDDEKQQIKSGTSSTKAAVAEDQDKRSAEQRFQALDEASQTEAQKEVVNGASLDGGSE